MLREHYSNAVATAALAVALTMGGAYAADRITSNEIATGAVKQSDIHRNAVTAKKAKFPVARSVGTSLETTGATVAEDGGFAPVAQLGTGGVPTGGTKIQVTWAGTGRADTYGGPCVFQLRVDGAPSASGGGEALAGQQVESVSATALFDGLSSGDHAIEIWARAVNPYPHPEGDRCVVGGAGVAQTLTVVPLVE